MTNTCLGIVLQGGAEGRGYQLILSCGERWGGDRKVRSLLSWKDSWVHETGMRWALEIILNCPQGGGVSCDFPEGMWLRLYMTEQLNNFIHVHFRHRWVCWGYFTSVDHGPQGVKSSCLTKSPAQHGWWLVRAEGRVKKGCPWTFLHVLQAALMIGRSPSWALSLNV